MKIVIVCKEKEKARLPEVGEFWKYAGHNTVYLRINDVAGRAIVGNRIQAFYSIEMNNGAVYHTFNLASGITILQPKNNCLELEEV